MYPRHPTTERNFPHALFGDYRENTTKPENQTAGVNTNCGAERRSPSEEDKAHRFVLDSYGFLCCLQWGRVPHVSACK
ncbi:hypothetical protein E2C01_086918 [Portunus trituberculatus]|uniref:Uncharacterized protein n=1 Tax=Portunus trituberculatus TaxID=210409 RepID=A0A5B7JER2_PORTR|nr:hypothetical protein [Portunus trituberculatus]